MTLTHHHQLPVFFVLAIFKHPVYLCKDPPQYFLFYFFEIPEIFPYKTPDLEYVNFATPCIMSDEYTSI
jgi:hypothetical protein